VDAHEDQRESNRVLLQLDGYAVMTAADAQQGLESFDWFLPNVVLVDRDLPGNQVAEFARKVRKAKVGSTAVLVALSAQAEQERRDVLAAGFDGVIAKPLKLADLRQVIELIARRGTPRTQTAANEQDRPARVKLNTPGAPYRRSELPRTARSVR
jgi:DNA-binding response OmpR family regulator